MRRIRKVDINYKYKEISTFNILVDTLFGHQPENKGLFAEPCSKSGGSQRRNPPEESMTIGFLIVIGHIDAVLVEIDLWVALVQPFNHPEHGTSKIMLEHEEVSGVHDIRSEICTVDNTRRDQIGIHQFLITVRPVNNLADDTKISLWKRKDNPAECSFMEYVLCWVKCTPGLSRPKIDVPSKAPPQDLFIEARIGDFKEKFFVTNQIPEVFVPRYYEPIITRQSSRRTGNTCDCHVKDYGIVLKLDL
jgi:hypothetical protein